MAALPAPEKLLRSDFPVLWPVGTRWADNDMFGHLNNAVYYQLFDTAINAWINTSTGVDPLAMPVLGIVAESGCRYFSELRFPESLMVGLAVTRLGRSSVTYRLGVFKEPDDAGVITALGHWVHVYVDRTSRRPVPIPEAIRSLLSTALRKRISRAQIAFRAVIFAAPTTAMTAISCSPRPRYASRMPVLSKTVEVTADAASIMAIVADIERYPEWNEGVKGAWVLARYDDGRPSQVRLDTAVQGIEGTYIHAVYYPGENQIQTVMQQGELFAKQEQLFSVVATGAASLLTVDMDVQVTMPVPEPMVKMLLNNVLEHLAENLKQRAEQLAAS